MPLFCTRLVEAARGWETRRKKVCGSGWFTSAGASSLGEASATARQEMGMARKRRAQEHYQRGAARSLPPK